MSPNSYVDRMVLRSLLSLNILCLVLTNICLGQGVPQKQGAPEKTIESNARVTIKLGTGRSFETSVRTASWHLGKNLATVMNLQARGVEASSFESSMTKAKQVAEALEVNFSNAPKIGGMGDVFQGIDFLTGDADGSVTSQIENRHSKNAAELFDLAVYGVVAGILYSAEKDPTQAKINAMLIRSLKMSFVGSGLTNEKDAYVVTAGLIKWMEDGNPEGKEMMQVVGPFFKTIEGVLESESGRKNSVNNVVPNAKQRTEPTALVSDPKTPEDLEAEKIVSQFLNPKLDRTKLTTQLIPDAQAARELLQESLAVRAAKVYPQLFANPSMGSLGPREGQTEFILKKISTTELRSGSAKARQFPGGYRTVADKLNPGFTIYQFSFVEPGESSGMRFDGLVKLNGQWCIFPKLWRLMDEKPFGIELEE